MLAVSSSAMLWTISVSNMILECMPMCVLACLHAITTSSYHPLPCTVIISHQRNIGHANSFFHVSFSALPNFPIPVPSLTSSPVCMLCPAGCIRCWTRCCWVGCRTSRWRVRRSIWWWWVPWRAPWHWRRFGVGDRRLWTALAAQVLAVSAFVGQKSIL